MLRELRIANYAVIDELELMPGEGFVVFTGETGAGKSIIIGALALALGERARSDQVRSGSAEAVVEARFGGPLPKGVEGLLEEAGLPAGDDLLLRRIVSAAGGKSRAYVNDRAVSLSTLEEIGKGLVDIHGQHQHQSLLYPETHLDYLDSFGKLMDRRERFREGYERWRELCVERERLASLAAEDARKLDYLAYQKEEIERATLRPGEDRELEAEREVLRHVERLAEASDEAERLLYSGDSPAAELVHRASRRLREITEIDSSLASLASVLEECQVQLEEAGREIQRYRGRLEANPARLEEIEERIARIGALRRKYGGTVEEILERLEEIRGEIALRGDGDGRRSAIEKELPRLARELSERALELSRLRDGHRRKLEKKVVEELRLLGMEGSAFEVEMEMVDDQRGGIDLDGRRVRLDERGADRVEFLLSANAGEPLKPLSRVASGGELSRIMLAIKSALSEVDQVPTLVFDEVDIGIGGRVARLVGDRLRSVSRGRQLLCVTHLPQIASLADAHYNIRKSSSGGRVRVELSLLEGEERTREIARMLGGLQMTETTERHAAELLSGKGEEGKGRGGRRRRTGG